MLEYDDYSCKVLRRAVSPHHISEMITYIHPTQALYKKLIVLLHQVVLLKPLGIQHASKMIVRSKCHQETEMYCQDFVSPPSPRQCPAKTVILCLDSVNIDCYNSKCTLYLEKGDICVLPAAELYKLHSETPLIKIVGCFTADQFTLWESKCLHVKYPFPSDLGYLQHPVLRHIVNAYAIVNASNGFGDIASVLQEHHDDAWALSFDEPYDRLEICDNDWQPLNVYIALHSLKNIHAKKDVIECYWRVHWKPYIQYTLALLLFFTICTHLIKTQDCIEDVNSCDDDISSSFSY